MVSCFLITIAGRLVLVKSHRTSCIKFCGNKNRELMYHNPFQTKRNLFSGRSNQTLHKCKQLFKIIFFLLSLSRLHFLLFLATSMSFTHCAILAALFSARQISTLRVSDADMQHFLTQSRYSVSEQKQSKHWQVKPKFQNALS